MSSCDQHPRIRWHRQFWVCGNMGVSRMKIRTAVFVHVLSSVHVCVLVARREHKGYVLELKPCRNDGTLGCFGTSCKDTFLMQTVLSIIRELFAETTFQILWHAMHAREINATRYSRDMHKKGQSKYHPSEAAGHSFLSKKRAGGTQKVCGRKKKKRRREKRNCVQSSASDGCPPCIGIQRSPRC